VNARGGVECFDEKAGEVSGAALDDGRRLAVRPAGNVVDHVPATGDADEAIGAQTRTEEVKNGIGGDERFADEGEIVGADPAPVVLEHEDPVQAEIRNRLPRVLAGD